MADEEFDYVKEASSLGWVPQEKWTGDPERWVDAQSYVERGEKILPILIKDKRKLTEDLRQTQEEVARLTKDGVTFRTMLEAQQAKERQELQATIDALQGERAQAITDGDGAAVVAAEKQIKAVEVALE